MATGLATFCRDKEGPRGIVIGATVVDTVPVPTVFLSREQLVAAPEWVVADSPTWSLSLKDLTEFGPNQVDNALILLDGVALVLSRRSPELAPAVHFFKPVERKGRLVSPPVHPSGAVFQELDHFALGNEVLMTGQWPGRRSNGSRIVWTLAADGSQVENATLPQEWGPALGVFNDHSLAVATDPIAGPVNADGRLSLRTILRVPDSFWRGAGTKPIIDLDTLWVIGAPRDVTGNEFLWGYEPLFDVEVSGDRIWLVPDADPEIVAVSSRGQTLLRVVWDGGNQTIPDSVLVLWRERAMRAIPDSFSNDARTRRIKWISEQRTAARFPAVASLRAGSNGVIYIRPTVLREYPTPASYWLMLDPKGKLLGQLRVPEQFEVLAFGDSYILAVERKHKHGERVARLNLARLSGPSSSDR